MADSLKIDPDCIVADVLSTWPRTIPVFYKNNMGCVGCVMAKFETLVDVAEIYGLEIEYLIDALQDAILAAEMGKGEG